MSVLLIYRSGIAYNEFNETYDKYKGNKVYAIVENEIIKNCMKYLYKDITFYFLNDLLKDKINMKFDYIIGNPPYQNKNGSKTGNLYFKISKHCLNLLKPKGIMTFITPKTIVGSRQFNITNIKELVYIDYTTNEKFNVGVDIISWCIDKTKKSNIVKIINKDYSVEYIETGKPMFEKESRLGIQIFKKIKSNIKDRLFKDDQSFKNAISKNGKYKIILNHFKESKYCYTNKKPSDYGLKKLLLSISKAYKKENIIISNESYNEMHPYVVIENLKDEEIENIKGFLFNDICINICLLSSKLSGTGFNNILKAFPKIDFSKKYTNKDIQNAFNLSDIEVKYILNFNHTLS